MTVWVAGTRQVLPSAGYLALFVPVCLPPATRIYKTQWDEVLDFVIVTGAIFFLLQKFPFKEPSAVCKVNDSVQENSFKVSGATVLSE